MNQLIKQKRSKGLYYYTQMLHALSKNWIEYTDTYTREFITHCMVHQHELSDAEEKHILHLFNIYCIPRGRYREAT